MLVISGLILVARTTRAVGGSALDVCGLGAQLLKPREAAINTFQYRTVGKVEYIARLAAWGKSLIALWASVTNVDDRALLFAKLQRIVEFASLLSRACLTGLTLIVLIIGLGRQRGMPSPVNMYCRTTSPLQKGRYRLRSWPLCGSGSKNYWAVLRNSRYFLYKVSAVMSPRLGYCALRHIESVVKEAAFICLMHMIIMNRVDCSIKLSIFFRSRILNLFWVVIGTSKSLNICWTLSRRPISGCCRSAGTLAVSSLENQTFLIGRSGQTTFINTGIRMKKSQSASSRFCPVFHGLFVQLFFLLNLIAIFRSLVVLKMMRAIVVVAMAARVAKGPETTIPWMIEALRCLSIRLMLKRWTPLWLRSAGSYYFWVLVWPWVSRDQFIGRCFRATVFPSWLVGVLQNNFFWGKLVVGRWLISTGHVLARWSFA